MTYEQAINALRNFAANTKATPAAQRQIADILAAIKEHVDLLQRQHASRELERLGHIVRHALTPAQYYAAEQAARAEHPEAWAGRLETAVQA